MAMVLRCKLLAILLLLFSGVQTASADVVDLLVPLRPIYPREPLRSSDFIGKQFLVSSEGARNYVLSVGQIQGMEAVKFLPSGRPVAIVSIRAVALVRKGELIEAKFESLGILIETKLIALEDGAAGARIRVRNPKTGRSMLALVDGQGQLSVLQ